VGHVIALYLIKSIIKIEPLKPLLLPFCYGTNLTRTVL
jgi:hypothetical protein